LRNRTSSHAKTKHIARDDIVSHQWPNGTGIKMKMSNSNHHHAERFREGGGFSPLIFSGISIIEVAAALKKNAGSQSNTTCLVSRVTGNFKSKSTVSALMTRAVRPNVASLEITTTLLFEAPTTVTSEFLSEN